jgi:hypothetical protein
MQKVDEAAESMEIRLKGFCCSANRSYPHLTGTKMYGLSGFVFLV